MSDESKQSAGLATSRQNHRSKFCSIHDTGIGLHTESTGRGTFSTTIVAGQAVGYENGVDIFFETDGFATAADKKSDAHHY